MGLGFPGPAQSGGLSTDGLGPSQPLPITRVTTQKRSRKAPQHMAAGAGTHVEHGTKELRHKIALREAGSAQRCHRESTTQQAQHPNMQCVPVWGHTASASMLQAQRGLQGEEVRTQELRHAHPWLPQNIQLEARAMVTRCSSWRDQRSAKASTGRFPINHTQQSPIERATRLAKWVADGPWVGLVMVLSLRHPGSHRAERAVGNGAAGGTATGGSGAAGRPPAPPPHR